VSQSRKTTNRTGGAVDWHTVLYQGSCCEDILKSCDGGITRTSIVFLSSKDMGAIREPLVLKIYTALKFQMLIEKIKIEIESVL
jgi:hypothetical protein